ncbi:hypothetical protein Syun_007283 [Stephania yunnanensis]|uniref:VQ domain-containing protein n=1 Tax=Stephania yunnanensis TaxID=152371 RepID=A0AAP0PYD8_9MAGN
MRQALEARLVVVEEIRKVVEQEKLDKEESIDLRKQELLMEDVVDVGDYEIGTCLVIHAVMRVRAVACIFMQDPQQQQHQPPVYNINKSDFRDVVQKLTGCPLSSTSTRLLFICCHLSKRSSIFEKNNIPLFGKS